MVEGTTYAQTANTRHLGTVINTNSAIFTIAAGVGVFFIWKYLSPMYQIVTGVLVGLWLINKK